MKPWHAGCARSQEGNRQPGLYKELMVAAAFGLLKPGSRTARIMSGKMVGPFARYFVLSSRFSLQEGVRSLKAELRTRGNSLKAELRTRQHSLKAEPRTRTSDGRHPPQSMSAPT